MSYIPHDRRDQLKMLKTLAVDSIDDLFNCIPKEVCFAEAPSEIPELSEQGIFNHLAELAAKNSVASRAAGWRSFLGAGSYHHYVPASVDALAGRGEFFTSYTPYQAEVSQGNLQAGFEFQSLIANLVGMDVANASMYDGANAFVEAIFMARRLKKGQRVLVSEAIHPQYLEVLDSYAKDLFSIERLPIDSVTGTTNLQAAKLDKEVFAVVLQYPNYFGCLEDLEKLTDFAKQQEIYSIVCNSEPIAFGALQPPGDFGVDIFAGEGQSLGNAVHFGGPHLGMLATSKNKLRQLPGRLVGKTTDSQGRSGYVLTLSTREQHIRRERATSNICTNQFLLALRAAIYMSLLGERGMQELAFTNAKRMTYFIKRLSECSSVKQRYTQPVFNECVVDLGVAAAKVCQQLESNRIIGGMPLEGSGLENCLLVNVTETHSEDDINLFCDKLQQAVKEVS